MNKASINSTNKLGDDKSVAGHSCVVGVVVVCSVVLGFKIVATIEEFADVSAAGSFDDEFAAWVVGSIVSSIENKIIEKEKVALSFSSDGVEFFFSHGCNWSPEFLELADVNLMTDFHECPGAEEENDNTNIKEKRATAKSDVLGFNT